MNALPSDSPHSVPSKAPSPQHKGAGVAPPLAQHTKASARVSSPSKPNDHFVRQQASGKPHDAKKPFNPWKWIVLTPIIAAVVLPVVAVGAAGAWFMHTPSTLDKSFTPEKLSKMLEAYRRNEKVEIPKGLRFPNYSGTNPVAFLQQGLFGFINAYRFLPQDNKWEVLKYVASPKGIKDLIKLGQFALNALSESNPGDLSFVATVLAKGGTVTKKWGQGYADKAKSKLIKLHASVLDLEEIILNKETPEIKRLNAQKSLADKKIAFKKQRKIFKDLSVLQSQEVELTKKQEQHFTHLYHQAIDAYNAQHPNKPLVKKSLRGLKKVEASTALVILQDDVAIKLQRSDARAANAVANFELMVHLNSIEQGISSIVSGKGAEHMDKDAIVKKSTEQAGAILQGSDFNSEFIGLKLMREAQKKAGIVEGLAPEPYLFKNIKGVDGHEYGAVVMEKVGGPGDLNSVTLNAMMSEHPFDLNSKEWMLYTKFMQEDAYATIVNQLLSIHTTDGHSGNFMLKASPVTTGKNGGAIPIDLAEHNQIPEEGMRKLARLFLACVKTRVIEDPDMRHSARQEALQRLEILFKDGGKGIKHSDKVDLLKEIETSPMRILNILYRGPVKEFTEDNYRTYSPNRFDFSNFIDLPLDPHRVRKAEEKFLPFIYNADRYERSINSSSETAKLLRKSKELAAKDILRFMERYATESVPDHERSTYIGYLRRNLLSTHGTREETTLADLQSELHGYKRYIKELEKQIAQYDEN
jgi:hypothetical protein